MKIRSILFSEYSFIFYFFKFFKKWGTQQEKCRVYCIITETRFYNLYYKKEVPEMVQSPVEFFQSISTKVCSVCGKHMDEQAESYMMECDRCLAQSEE
jgi:hypothetical protein